MAGSLTLPINMLVNVSIEYQAKLLSRDAFNRLCIVGATVPNARGTDSGIYTTLDGVKLDYGVEAAEYKIAQKYFAQSPRPRDVMIATVTALTDPVAAIAEVATKSLGFYAFCFATEVAAASIQAVAEWAQDHNRMFMTVMTDDVEATATGNTLKELGQYHYCISYHEDYATIGAIAGMALDQRYDKRDGIKTLHLKSLTSVVSTDISQAQAASLKAACVNYYSDYGNPDNSLPIFANGHAGGGKFFDFVMGFDWLRNVIETNVFNGQRLRRLTPQTDRGMMMIKADIVNGLEEAVNAGLVAAGQWNGAALGEIETYDYLATGYYVYNESIREQPQVIREQRIAPPFTILVKGAGAIHDTDITLIPEA